MREGLGDKEVVPDLEEGGHRGLVISRAGCPLAAGLEGGLILGASCQPERRRLGGHPVGKLVATGKYLVGHPLHGVDTPSAVLLLNPGPEGRDDVEPVVPVLCIDEDIGVDQVHQATPSRCPSSWKVEYFLKPSSRKASRCRVLPSSVSAISARANRLLTRTG